MNRVITSSTSKSYTVWDLGSKHWMEFGVIDGQIRVIRQSRMIQDNHLKYYKLLARWLQLKAWVIHKWGIIVKKR